MFRLDHTAESTATGSSRARHRYPFLIVSLCLSLLFSVLAEQGMVAAAGASIAFNAPVNYHVGSGPHGVVSADFNGDGRPDLAVANYNDGTVSILLSCGTSEVAPCNGAGMFQPVPGRPISVGSGSTSGPYALAVGHFGGTGLNDIAVANFSDGTLSVLLNCGTSTVTPCNGPGTFEPAPGGPVSAGSGPYALTEGDFNGDGLDDLAVANYNSGTVTVLLNCGSSTTAPCNGPGTFKPAPGSPISVGSGAGSHPDAITMGAFGGAAGASDLAVANYGDSTVSILQNCGSSTVAPCAGPGTFKPDSAGLITVGSGPDAIATATFAGSAWADLAVANYNDSTVSVLLGNGSGSFSRATGSPFVVGSGPDALAVAQFTASGNEDIAAANYSDGTVSVLLGNSTGGFSPAPGATVVGGNPEAIAVGDFNGDLVPDFVTANFDSKSVSVRLGKDDGTFIAAPSSPAGAGPVAVAVGDFAHTGKQDLAVVNHSAGTVGILLGDGAGKFTTGPTYAVGAAPDAVTASDFNDDGYLDLAVANGGDGTVTILLNCGTSTVSPCNGPGTFQQAPNSPISVGSGAGSGPDAVAAGNFNGDTYPDLAVANGNDGTISVLLNCATGHASPCNGPGTFRAASGSPVSVGSGAGSGPDALVVGDFNGDSEQDLAVANGNDGSVSVLLGNGSGGFSNASHSPIYVGSGPDAVVSARFNADTLPDLAVSNHDDSTVSVLLNCGASTTGPCHGLGTFENAPGSPVAVGAGPDALAAQDFNNDGTQDLVTANFLDNSMTALSGNGDGTFSGRVDYATGAGPKAMAVADFNADSQPDVAVANGTGGSISVLLNATPSVVTAARVLRFTARGERSARHGRVMVFRWRVASRVGIAGFAIYAGAHRVNMRLIRAHDRLSYHYREHWTGKGPYSLRLLLADGRWVLAAGQ